MRCPAIRLLVLLLALGAPALHAGTPPPGFTETPIVSGLDDPTDIAFSPLDGSLWITERLGKVFIHRTGQTLKEIFDFSVLDGCEQGLLGITFDPQFTTNHRVYFYYTFSGPPERNRLVRYVENNDVITFDALLIDDLFVQACNHDGGGIKFGPDGYIYVGVGENAVSSNAQDLTTPLGKVLRVTTDGAPAPGNPFSPPNDARIWAYGLRNPWRIHFDGPDLYIGDVGQSSWEEINYGVAGANYGWPICEGDCNPPNPSYTDPIHAYPHDTNEAGAIAGPVYRGSNFPASFQGTLFFGDIGGFVWWATLDANHNVTSVTNFIDDAASNVSMEVGPDGYLYYSAYYGNYIAQVAYTAGPGAPNAEFTGTPRTGTAPLAVQFTDATTGSVTSWAWTFGDGGTSTQQSPSHTYAAPGTYDVALTATGTGGSDTETKLGYVVVTAADTENLVTGLGPGGSSSPRVQAFDVVGQPFSGIDFNAYGTGGFGVNVGSGNIDGAATDELLTGPGPSQNFGPQVRAFSTPSASPIAKVNFFAYGTLKYGVRSESVLLDGDAPAEILTSPGPGDVFGPHVRGFNWDGGTLSAVSKVSFFAFSTLKYGARQYAGSVDTDQFDELVVGAGPGLVFGANVRGFNYDAAAVTAIQKINFIAYATLFLGAEVAAADVDGDGFAEILTGPGARAVNPSHVRGWNYDGATLAAMSGLDFHVYNDQYGVLVNGADADGDGDAEILTTPADPTLPSNVLGFDYEGGNTTPISSLDFVSDGTARYGGNVEGGDYGF